MASSRPTIRPLPSFSRRMLLGLGVASVPAAVLGVPQSARAEPVDPSLGAGETRIVDTPLTDAELISTDPAGPLRRVDAIAATMIGCTWTGAVPDTVRVRGRALDGTWGAWVELEQAFNPDTGEATPGTEPSWLGGIDAVDVVARRGGGDVTAELTAHVVTTAPRAQDAGAIQVASGSGATGATGRIGALGAIASTSPGEIGPNAPTIITREQWGADESLVGGVSTASELKAVTLHHTEGSNSYTQAESAQQVRGILNYHTKTLGWADIGYNFLIDKYGQVFEARHGGLERHVIGAHARGFNTGTCGISLMGSYMSTSPSSAALAAIAQVSAWKLLGAMRTDVREKQGFAVSTSNVNFPVGTTAMLPRIFAHRDVNSTDCPGDRLYARLDSIRDDVQARIDRGWRVHLDAYARGGGAGALGTVRRIAEPRGGYIATILTQGLIISDGSSNARAYASPFGTSWESSWGRPSGSARTLMGVTLQRFQNGWAIRKDSGVSFRKIGFSDVPTSMKFSEEIQTLAALEITTGYPDGTYRPFTAINRDAMIAFIHRAMGAPAFTPPAVSPFRDLTPSTMFYREICWAVATGITQGFPDGTFRPTVPVQRQAVAAFLHRASGSPSVAPGGPAFRDVPAGHQFHQQISWLASTGITTGYPDGTFRPDAPVLRDAMAAFVVRWLAYREQ